MILGRWRMALGRLRIVRASAQVFALLVRFEGPGHNLLAGSGFSPAFLGSGDSRQKIRKHSYIVNRVRARLVKFRLPLCGCDLSFGLVFAAYRFDDAVAHAVSLSLE
jgi:hypothetical protein